ncbi:hypothetical protein Patl1_24355 [Pistacia atlantica]|uniref:Uncharacterized protein n=1 Tax=Pistacia atlantica TaxID=434234 RepID=A0ACC0ZXV2_9ROSI|nr:hypothetical protein Patl1_24355 [Pistacia atlantica]
MTVRGDGRYDEVVCGKGGGRGLVVHVCWFNGVTRVYVEAIPVDFVEPRTLLEAQPEDNEGFVRQDNEEVEEGIPDEFYWSVESDESDHEEDHESRQDGQGSGVVEGIETGQESGVVEGIEIGQGSGGVEGNQTG